MCRVLGYLGPSLPLADLMLRPSNSLVHQTFDAEYHGFLQLAGSGLASWEEGSPQDGRPLLYKSASPPAFDTNLRTICENVRTTGLLAHVRAIPESEHAAIHADNCQPVSYPGFRWALAHNGSLPGWRDMLHEMLTASRPEIVAHLTGSTDTEAIYCLLMSQLPDPTGAVGADQIVTAIRQLVAALVRIKRSHQNADIAKLKLFLASGDDLVVANIGLGPDYTTTVDRDWQELRSHGVGSMEFELAGVIEPVWYLAGRHFGRYEDSYDMAVCDIADADTVIIASEPLTRDRAKWHTIPFQQIAVFERIGSHIRYRSEPLDPD